MYRARFELVGVDGGGDTGEETEEKSSTVQLHNREKWTQNKEVVMLNLIYQCERIDYFT